MHDLFLSDAEKLAGSRGEEDPNLSPQIFNDVEILVYQKSRYIPEMSPSDIFIPRKENLIKMMRGCLGV